MAGFCCVMLRSKILTYFGYAAVLSLSQALHNLHQIAYLNGRVAGFCCVTLCSKILTYYGYAAVLSLSQALHNLRQIAYLNRGVAGFCCVMLRSKIAVKGALEPLEALGVATTAKKILSPEVRGTSEAEGVCEMRAAEFKVE